MRTTIKCKFLGLVSAVGEPITDMGNVPYGIRAKVIRLSDHPRLGPPDDEYKCWTITSRVKLVDFSTKIIVTENNVYDFS